MKLDREALRAAVIAFENTPVTKLEEAIEAAIQAYLKGLNPTPNFQQGVITPKQLEEEQSV